MKNFRVKAVFFVFAFSIVCLSANLFNIAAIKQSTLSAASSEQSRREETVKKYRGCIFDKNMIPLVDSEAEPAALKTGQEISVFKRYGEKSIARHIVGYTLGDGTGASGLEAAFDSELRCDADYEVSYITDAVGNIIKNKISAKKNSAFIPDRNIMTTLDYKIQKIAEASADKYIKSGAIVILDVENFDLVACVSRPDFDQSDVNASFESDNSPLLNKALCSYNAGSIFKIITSAAILESGCTEISDSAYLCSGTYSVDGKDFLCNKTDGHGTLDFKTAFAKSCNCFFYNASSAAGGRAIAEAAEKFGIGNTLLNASLDEASGYVPKKEIYGLREAANMSIGQGEILVTPLQAANMACIIANGGISRDINIADAVTDKYGVVLKNLRNENSRPVISKATAAKISEMMREAVLEGTAQSVQNGIVAIAGKTGTAQTGWVENGEIMTHGWFCGFFPYENPKYAMAVFSENGKNGSSACIPAFKEITLEITSLFSAPQ